jgi:hypothetical protein
MIAAEDELLKASRWRSVSEIPDFPFKSFNDVKQALSEGRCYISIDRSKAHRFAPLFNGPVARALDTLLSNVPILIAIASVIAAVSFRDAWLLFGVPAAVLGFVVGSSVHNLVRQILNIAPRDSAVPILLRLAAKILLAGMSFGSVIGLLLFGGLLLTAHTAAAWIVASYLISVYALRAFLTHGVLTINSAAGRSEPSFLFALSHGLCGLRDKSSDKFIGVKPWEAKS